MLKGFEYIANENSNILILGTFPGEESRKLHEYYGNQRNQFWKIIFNAFEVKYDKQISYDQKIKFLLKNNIALWDVVHKCVTDGSLDSKIKYPIFNDIEKFLNENKNINKVFFNGKMAYNFVKNQDIDKSIIKILPSTSPTNTIRYDSKLLIWKSSILCN